MVTCSNHVRPTISFLHHSTVLSQINPLLSHRAMSDEHADHHLGELTEGQGSTAIGWSEIRNAPESTEMMRATGLEDA